MMNASSTADSIRKMDVCPFCLEFVYYVNDKSQIGTESNHHNVINSSGEIKCEKCKKFFKPKVAKESPPTRRNFSRSWPPLIKLTIFAVAVFFAVAVRVGDNGDKRDDEFEIKREIFLLRKKFPSQTNDSWKWIASALNATGNQPKTLLLLYGPDDASTCDRLKEELVDLHRRRTRTTDGHVAFAATDAADYGAALERYKPLIKKPGALAVDLNLVSGRMAMVFYFLSDETSPEGNPALLIYTLRDAAKAGIRRAFSRAEASVREIWRELPENEMAPLISRVVKNVVLVRPEDKK